MTEPEHFKGCHPEHEHAPRNATPPEPQEAEECWHCATPTTRGCGCAECWEDADDVPPEVVYHCGLCGRWWAYMQPRITTITFDPQAPCLYQCQHHHGVAAHTIDCVLPSPMAAGAYVCDDCRAEAVRQEIAADPYCRGDDYAMFGDDE